MKQFSLILTFILATMLSFADDKVMFGIASYYGDYFHGRKTASGEVYNQYKLTAAHKTLPLGTIVKVTNTQNSKSVYLKVNDRGPYIAGRIIDVSTKAATILGFKHKGTTQVKVEVVKPDEVPLDLNKEYKSDEELVKLLEAQVIPKEEWNDIPTVDSNLKSAVDNTTKNNHNEKNQDSDASFSSDNAVLNKNYFLISSILDKSQIGYYGLQLGLFTDFSNVLKLIQQLQEQEMHEIFIQELKQQDSLIQYKVLVGKFANRAYADALKTKFSEEFKDSFVVKY